MSGQVERTRCAQPSQQPQPFIIITIINMAPGLLSTDLKMPAHRNTKMEKVMKLQQLWMAAVLLGGGAVGCAESDNASVPSSPTGTTLSPREGLGEAGYEVIDEVCDDTNSSTYMQRFVTPMFRDIAVVGDTAFLVDGSLLWAMNIEDSYAPKRISLTRLPGTPKSIAASGETLFVADGRDEILVIDGSNPAAPAVSTALTDLPGTSLDVTVSEETLFIAAGKGGLVTADISEPSEPVLLGRAAIPGFAAATAVEGDFAYVAACTRAAVVNVSNPATPTFVSSISVPEGHAREAAVEDSRLLLSGGEALFLADVYTPSAPEIISFYRDYAADGFYVNAAVIQNGIAYIAAGDESFRAVDILRMRAVDSYVSPSDTEAMLSLPVELDPPGTVFVVNSDPIGIAVQDDRLFVLGNFRWVGERLLRILDISSPYEEPTDLGRYAQPKTLTGVDAFGTDVVLHQTNGETIRTNIDGKELGRLTLPSAVQKVVTDGDRAHLLLANGNVGRTSDFETYTRIARDMNDVAASSTTVFVADPLHNSLRSEQTDAPFTAVSGEVTVENAFLGFARLHAEGSRVYAYDWAMGELHVARQLSDGTPVETGNLYIGECEAYDIADYFSGQELDKVRTASTAEGFALLCPFDTFGAPSVLMLDLQDPDAPVVADRIDLPVGRYADFEVTDDAVYTVEFDNNDYRSTILRTTDGDRTETTLDGAAVGLAVIGDEVFVADQDFGLRHFQYRDETLTPVDTTETTEAIR